MISRSYETYLECAGKYGNAGDDKCHYGVEIIDVFTGTPLATYMGMANRTTMKDLKAAVISQQNREISMINATILKTALEAVHRCASTDETRPTGG